MKVHQIISEAEIKEWNPKDALMKKFGSQTAATKMDIDAETKKLAGEFTAYYKNTPDGVPTTELLFKYLKDKGLPIGSEQDILGVLDKLGKRMSQKVGGAMSKAAGAVKKGVQGGKSGVGRGAAAVGRGIDKVKQAGATALQPQPKQGEFQFNSIVYESAYNILKEEPLQQQDVNRLINYYVKSGFQGTASPGEKSKYGGGPIPKAASGTTPKAAGGATIPKGTTVKGSGGSVFTADGNGGWLDVDGNVFEPKPALAKNFEKQAAAGGAGKPVGATKSNINPGDNIELDKAIEIVKAHGYQVTK